MAFLFLIGVWGLLEWLFNRELRGWKLKLDAEGNAVLTQKGNTCSSSTR